MTLAKHCDGGKHVALFYMWWHGDLAYLGGPEVQVYGNIFKEWEAQPPFD